MESLKFLSHVMHSMQGGAFLIIALAAGYACDKPGSRLKTLMPVSLLLAGIVSLAAVPAILGNWNIPAVLKILQSNQMFLLLAAVSFLCIGAGLAETLSCAPAESRTWDRVSSVFLLACAGTYLGFYLKVNEEAARQVMILHMGIGLPLAVAAAVRLAESVWTSRPLRIVWIILLLVASIQLLTYRESLGISSPATVTMYMIAG